MTIDMWADTSRKMSYTKLTAHFINKEWELKSNRPSCSAHNLNIVLSHSFKADTLKAKGAQDMINTLGACKRTVTFNKKSELNQKLKRSVHQHVETRWNSKLMMLQLVERQIAEVRLLLDEERQSAKLEGFDEHLAKNLTKFLEFSEGNGPARERKGANVTSRAAMAE
ncbi:hypothetical protein J437_LFUL019433 [Ladona fulva]|uniref:Uncharacterized protein n=1 Tax=Ladona fulva TaxID=123851 RepID=A0A8K0PDZ1_LADFU|nr:hypothetical protein J437_LFUL019433 [Ladona fulva]